MCKDLRYEPWDIVRRISRESIVCPGLLVLSTSAISEIDAPGVLIFYPYEKEELFAPYKELNGKPVGHVGRGCYVVTFSSPETGDAVVGKVLYSVQDNIWLGSWAGNDWGRVFASSWGNRSLWWVINRLLTDELQRIEQRGRIRKLFESSGESRAEIEKIRELLKGPDSI
jgi:hypothetical protein